MYDVQVEMYRAHGQETKFRGIESADRRSRDHQSIAGKRKAIRLFFLQIFLNAHSATPLSAPQNLRLNCRLGGIKDQILGIPAFCKCIEHHQAHGNLPYDAMLLDGSLSISILKARTVSESRALLKFKEVPRLFSSDRFCVPGRL